MSLQLASVNGGPTIALDRETLVVGRGDQCDVSLDRYPSVSRRHCLLAVDDGAVLLKDLGSMNGVWVNNRKLRGLTWLRRGDVVRIGGATFVLQWDGSGPEPRDEGRSHSAIGTVRKVFVGGAHADLSSETTLDHSRQPAGVS